MKSPWLSVLMPVYNGEAYIASALDSIAVQGDNDIECIVVDGDSADGTLAVVKSYQDKLRLQILHRERTTNWVMKTNHALSSARGEYVCFLHHDDLWLNNRLDVMRQLIEKFSEVALFLHPSYYINSRGRTLGLWSCPLPVAPKVIPSALMIENLLIQNFVSILGPIFKRDIAINVGGMDESLWYTADWDFWLKMAASGQAVYHPKPLSCFRIHPHSQTIRRSARSGEFREQLEIVANKHLTQWNAATGKKQLIKRIAAFSIDVNISLAGAAHGSNISFVGLLFSFASLGPAGWYHYLKSSRIWERVTARIRGNVMKLNDRKNGKRNKKKPPTD